jgi:hypothetical protein
MIELDIHYDIDNQRIFEGKEKQGIRSNFIFYVPYHLLLHPDDDFEIRLPKNPDKKHFLKLLTRNSYTLNHNHRFLGFDKIEESDKLKTVLFRNGDRFGITGYSRVLISYDRFVDIFDSDKNIDGDKLNKAIEMICEVFNYFLDIYAATVKHRQVMKLSPQDIHTLDFNHSDSDGNSFNVIRFFTIHGATIVEGLVSPHQPVINRLKELLKSGDPNLAFCSLGVSAVRNVYGGEYLSAVVQAVTQLESFLYTLFRERFSNKDIKETNRILMSLGLSNLLEMLNLILADTEVGEIKSKVNLDKVIKAINIRNKYIHEGANIANINNLLTAEEYVDEINELCVEIAKLIGIDHSLNEEKTGW